MVEKQPLLNSGVQEKASTEASLREHRNELLRMEKLQENWRWKRKARLMEILVPERWKYLPG